MKDIVLENIMHRVEFSGFSSTITPAERVFNVNLPLQC